ncbi:MAG: reverse transcriptase family protein [Acidobacteria bacterium]|nr:reverse transcriptase family protein [Acidobacteriota bacterium]
MKLFDSIRDRFKGGRTPAELAKWLELPENELRAWLKGMPSSASASRYAYTQFSIPKRHGGSREIAAPSDDLKALQRRVLRKLIRPLPVHPAATGFVRGRSIVHNARPHSGKGVVINLDLRDFFPSISSERVQQAFRALGWDRDASRILMNICCHDRHLPQGAPTSPALSNLICRKLDARLAALVGKAHEKSLRARNPRTGEAVGSRTVTLTGGQYTRYADDLTFSFASSANGKAYVGGRELLSSIRKIIESEGFEIQMKKKVRVQRAHQRQTATGLVVNHSVNLPREVRRKIRAMQHRERTGTLGPKEKAQLRGWEALAGMVERQRSS